MAINVDATKHVNVTTQASGARGPKEQAMEQRRLNGALFDAIHAARTYDEKTARRDVILQSVQDALVQGANPNAMSTRVLHGKTTPLGMLLSSNGAGLGLVPELFRMLLDHGADLHRRDSQGNTYLHVLRDSGQYRFNHVSDAQRIAMFLEAGAGPLLNVRNHDDQHSPLDEALLAYCSSAACEALVKTLVDFGSGPQHLKTTTLLRLVQHQRPERFQLAVSLGVNVTEGDMPHRLWKAFLESFKPGSRQATLNESSRSMMDTLLSLGVNPSLPWRRPEERSVTILGTCSTPTTEETFPNPLEASPVLDYALRRFSRFQIMPTEMLGQLLRLGCSPNLGFITPLQSIAQDGYAHHLVALQAVGFDVTVLNSLGQSLLHNACKADPRVNALWAAGPPVDIPGTVRCVLQAGLDPNLIDPTDGTTPLYQVISNRDLDLKIKNGMVNALLERGANPNQPNAGEARSLLFERLLFRDSMRQTSISDDIPPIYQKAYSSVDGSMLHIIRSLTSHGLRLNDRPLANGFPWLIGVTDSEIAQTLVQSADLDTKVSIASQTLIWLVKRRESDPTAWGIVDRLTQAGFGNAWGPALSQPEVAEQWAYFQETTLEKQVERLILESLAHENLNTPFEVSIRARL